MFSMKPQEKHLFLDRRTGKWQPSKTKVSVTSPRPNTTDKTVAPPTLALVKAEWEV